MPSNRPLICLIGESGSGKTTLANTLKKDYGLTVVESYTTRPKRTENETGHIFVSNKEFKKLHNIVARCTYNGYRYCATKMQIETSDVYVVDPVGLDSLKRNVTFKRRIVAVYVSCSETARKQRMLDRGDSIERVETRLTYDREAFRGCERIADCTVINEFKDDIPVIADDIFSLWHMFGGYLAEET